MNEFRFVKVLEVGVLQSHSARYSLVWLQGHHLRKQVHCVLIHILHMLAHWDSFPLRESLLEVLVLHCIWPKMVIRRTLYREYFEYLIDFRVADEQGFALGHLSIDTANAPNIYWC